MFTLYKASGGCREFKGQVACTVQPQSSPYITPVNTAEFPKFAAGTLWSDGIYKMNLHTCSADV
jgi:hypothetical protein